MTNIHQNSNSNLSDHVRMASIESLHKDASKSSLNHNGLSGRGGMSPDLTKSAKKQAMSMTATHNTKMHMQPPVMNDPQTGHCYINPQFRRQQVKRKVDHYFKQ